MSFDNQVEDSDNARVRTSMTIRPDVLDKVKLMAKHKKVSVSRFIEDVLASQFESLVDQSDYDGA